MLPDAFTLVQQRTAWAAGTAIVVSANAHQAAAATAHTPTTATVVPQRERRVEDDVGERAGRGGIRVPSTQTHRNEEALSVAHHVSVNTQDGVAEVRQTGCGCRGQPDCGRGR